MWLRAGENKAERASEPGARRDCSLAWRGCRAIVAMVDDREKERESEGAMGERLLSDWAGDRRTAEQND